MRALKRVYGKVIKKNDEGITVNTRKKVPVFVPVSELAREDVSVIVWKHGTGDGLAVGCTVDVTWWDSAVDNRELFGSDGNDGERIDQELDFGHDDTEEGCPF